MDTTDVAQSLLPLITSLQKASCVQTAIGPTFGSCRPMPVNPWINCDWCLGLKIAFIKSLTFSFLDTFGAGTHSGLGAAA